jgi:hypothetical protein
MSKRRKRVRDKRIRHAVTKRPARIAAGAGLSLGAALGMASGAQATDYLVTDPGDGPAPGPTGSLREAVDLANNNAGPDKVVFQSGITGITLTDGEIDIYDALQIVGPGAGSLSISGNDSSRIFDIDGTLYGPPALPVSISGVTLTEGSEPASDGGAIRSGYADLTIADAVITGNNVGTGGTDDYSGGGIYAYDGFLTVNRSSFTDNHVTEYDGSGGAIISINQNSVEISDSTVSGNTSEEFGGAISSISPGDLLIEDSTLSGNNAGLAGVGGALASQDSGSTTIRRSTISGNASNIGPGGGVFSVNESLSIENSTISGNSTKYVGGGVTSYVGTVAATDSTIAGNNATEPSSVGGGVFLCDCSSATLSGSIVADNRADEGDDIYFSSGGPPLEASFSMVEAPVEGGGTVDETVAGSNKFGQDPQLGPLAANGGPTRTRALAQTSPAVDAGSAFGLGTDQRGESRPFDSFIPNSAAAGADGSDIGAFELKAIAPPKCKGRDATVVGAGGFVRGTTGPDVIVGSDNRDVIRARGGKDLVCAGAGDDKLMGGPGDDRLRGEAGDDRLIGGSGKDRLKGGPGEDELTQ